MHMCILSRYGWLPSLTYTFYYHTSNKPARSISMDAAVKEEPQDVKLPKISSKKSTAITVEQIQEDRITEVSGR